jgi:hypothetical protein
MASAPDAMLTRQRWQFKLGDPRCSYERNQPCRPEISSGSIPGIQRDYGQAVPDLQKKSQVLAEACPIRVLPEFAARIGCGGTRRLRGMTYGLSLKRALLIIGIPSSRRTG